MGIQRKRWRLRGVRLGGLDPAAESRLASQFCPLPAPGVALGCSKLERRAVPTDEAEPVAPAPMSQAQPAEQQAQSGARYGVAGPADDREQAAKAAEAPAAAAPLAGSDEHTKGELGLRSGGGAAEEKSGGLGSIGTLGHGTGIGVGAGGRQRQVGGSPPAGGPAAPPPATLAETPADLPRKRAADALAARGSFRDDDAKEGDKAAQTIAGFLGGKDAGWQPPVLATCSDLAARPLFQRLLLWRKRLANARSPGELIQVYEAARRACELPDWAAERTFLGLLQRHVKDEAAAAVVLGHFAGRRDVQRFVATLILRRAVDPRLAAAVERIVFGSAVNWAAVDLELMEIADVQKRIAKLREWVARAPEDPNGDIRLVALLSVAGQKDEALAQGRRLRDRGMMTPDIARRLGDVLARAGLEAEALRTYSEIVEFDPDGADSRRLLGDVFLAHRWYGHAYREYKTIADSRPDDALGWLRLAAAAAGAGRVDEALRVERRVASAQGNPGPSDPRRWARLASAARLARLIAEPPPPAPGQPAVDPARRRDNLERELKELQLLSGPGTLVVVTWEDLTSELDLLTRVDKKNVALGDATDAARAGLYGIVLSAADLARATPVARLRTVLKDDPIALVRHDLTWDGKRFQITLKRVELGSRQREVGI
jgi:tetratricopeptide (TPR) repeat protein